MKSAAFFPAAAIAASLHFLTSCDNAPKSPAEARKEAAAQTEKAGDDLREKAEAALEAGKDLGAGALDRAKELAGKASDFAREKIENLPELETVLGDVRALVEEAKEAAKDGVSPEKRAELKARWEAAEAKAREKTEELSPVIKEKANAAVDTARDAWNALMRKIEEKAHDARTD